MPALVGEPLHLLGETVGRGADPVVRVNAWLRRVRDAVIHEDGETPFGGRGTEDGRRRTEGEEQPAGTEPEERAAEVECDEAIETHGRRGGSGGQRAESGGRRTEDRGQRAEDGDQTGGREGWAEAESQKVSGLAIIRPSIAPTLRHLSNRL